MKDNKNQESVAFYFIFCLSVVLILVAWISMWWIAPWLSGGKLSEAGQSGDMFGSINALFSGLAFAGLITTLIFQRSELEAQRKEIELSRVETSLQRFESTLFGLIKLFNEHVASIEQTSVRSSNYGAVAVVTRGRAYIRLIADTLPDQKYFEREVMILMDSPDPKPQQRSLEDQNDLFRKAFDEQYEADFGPYMRLLYGIFRHIDFGSLSSDQKKMYSRIARAHLSSSEVKFIMFNCCSVGRDFRPWIEKYGLLKHLTPSEKEKNPDMVASYDQSAFDSEPTP